MCKLSMTHQVHPEMCVLLSILCETVCILIHKTYLCVSSVCPCVCARVCVCVCVCVCVHLGG